MKPDDKADFLRIMNGMAAVFGGQITPEALDVWWSAFAGWSVHEFTHAASAAVTRCKFMPRPADLYEVRKASRPTPGEAWEIAGQGKDVLADKAFSIATQGRYFGHIQYDEHPWIQKRFLELYAQLVEVDDARSSAPQLAAPSWMQGEPARLSFRNADGVEVDQHGERISGDQARQNLQRLKHLIGS